MKTIKGHLLTKAYIAFAYYAGSTYLNGLIFELKIIEQSLGGGDNKNIWFRFFPGDTLVTTIQNIEADLSSNTNKQYLIDKINVALDNVSLEMYYS